MSICYRQTVVSAIVAVTVAIICSACARTPPEIRPFDYVSASQSEFWRPKDEKMTNPVVNDQMTGFIANTDSDTILPSSKLNLSQLIDIALRNNPDTKEAWASAKASAAGWASVRGEYYPQIDAAGAGGGQKTFGMSGGAFAEVSASLNYLLLDFGGRSARSEAARQALIEANWNHNQFIQDVLRDVPQAYYTYIGDKAQVEASRKSLVDAQTTLDATRVRRQAGVSTIADVLQAEAHAAQAKVDLVRDEGDVEISRGRLATTVGWPANKRFEVADGFDKLPYSAIKKNVDWLINIAQGDRPSLNAAVAMLRKKEAELKDAKAKSFPKFSAQGQSQWQRLVGRTDTPYYGGVQVEMPIFHGFALRNDIRKAKAEIEAARAALRSEQENVIKDVWDAYYNFRTASRQVGADEALLKSSRESYNVSLGRYKAGVAEITELIDAQTILASARAELISAKMNLFTSYAELLHAIGSELPIPSAEASINQGGSDQDARRREKK